MPIEFDCPHCQHRLRTPDSKAGMSARCPACSEKIWVPYSHEMGSGEAGENRPLSSGPPPLPSLSGATGTSSHEQSDFVDAHAGTAKLVECPECGFENDPRNTICEDCGALLRVSKRRPRTQQARSQTVTFEVGTTLADAWAVYTKHLAPLMFGPLLLGLCMVPLIFIGIVPLFCLFPAGAAMDPTFGMVALLGMIIVGIIAIVTLQSAVSVGVHWAHFRTFEGETPTIGDHFFAFSGGWQIVKRMVGLMMLMTLIIIPTCGLAGFVMWPIPALLVHRDLGPMDALNQGWGLIMEQFGTILLLSLACVGIGVVASFVPLGGLFAAPFISLVYSLGTLRLLGDPAVIPGK